MKKRKKQNFIKYFLGSLLLILSIFIIDNMLNEKNMMNTIVTTKVQQQAQNEVLKLPAGTYSSSDGHTLTVDESETVLYDGVYSLTINYFDNGNTVSGKIGSNNKAVTFYQLNSSTLVSGETINYTHNGSTVYLYDYTVFSLDSYVPEVDENGAFELYRNNNKVNTYKDLQSAISAASSLDTVKITKDSDILSGAYISGKNITIEGNNHILNKSDWGNSILVIEEDATVSINNLTIDGGATGFEVDYTLSYPAVKAGTLDNDPKSNVSAVISKGNLNLTATDFSNHYTTSSGSAIRIISGNASFKDSDFNHNYGQSFGAAIYIGSSFKPGQTTYPVKTITFENCEFKDNYTIGGNGGAIAIISTETIKFNDCDFIRNMANGYTAGGGAILFYSTSVAPAESNNLEYTQAYFDNCLFEENYSGNDGYAIQNESAELYITNCDFMRNEGLDAASSVGTVSCMLDGNRWYDVVIEKSNFIGNVMEASVLGDHGTLVNLEMTDVNISENVGKMSILLYTGNAKFTNVNFENEKVTTTVIDVRTRISEAQYPLYTPATIILNNVTFENTDGPTDVLVRRHNHNMSYNTATLVLEGENKANVHVWDALYLTMDGTNTGDIVIDDTTPVENITISENAILNGNFINNKNTYTITLYYPNGDDTSVRYLYLEKDKTYTYKELYMLHMIGQEDKKLAYYTKNDFSDEWNFVASGNITLYANFIDHTHTDDGTLIVYENAIYEQCECGYLSTALKLSSPDDLIYNGKEKKVKVINNIGIAEDKYSVVYYYQNQEGNWEKVDTYPKAIGKYKAQLTYNGMTIEHIYEIKGEIDSPSPDKINGETNNQSPDEIKDIDNPSTGDSVSMFIKITIISLIVLAISTYCLTKTLKNKNN